jgi:uncharacterized membrane protein
MNKKTWYLSKTLWVNVISIVAIIAQGLYGKEIFSAELQVMLLSLVNIALRAITTEGLK